MNSAAALDRFSAKAIEFQFVNPLPLRQLLGAMQEHRFDEMRIDLLVRHPGTSLPENLAQRGASRPPRLNHNSALSAAREWAVQSDCALP